MNKIWSNNYYGQADLFAVWCPQTRKVYVVPVDEIGTTGGSFRVDPLKRTMENIRWAKDYELCPRSGRNGVPSMSYKHVKPVQFRMGGPNPKGSRGLETFAE